MFLVEKKTWIKSFVICSPVVALAILFFSKSSNTTPEKDSPSLNQHSINPPTKMSFEDLPSLYTPLHYKLLLTYLKTIENSSPNEDCSSMIKKSYSNGIILEFRPSYFYPISKEIREAFHNGGINYQITGQFPLYYGKDAWLQGINVWAAVDYFSRDGRTSGLNNKTKLRIIPLTLGLKFFFPPLGTVAPVNFYLGTGMKYFFVHNYTDSDFVKRNIDVNGMGGVVETGFTTTVVEHLVFDVFGSYSFRTFGPPNLSKYPAVEPTVMNISGINIGGGIGYKF